MKVIFLDFDGGHEIQSTTIIGNHSVTPVFDILA